MTAVSVTTASTTILAPNSVYSRVKLQNLGAGTAFIQFDGGTAAAANSGYSMAANAVLDLEDNQCRRGIYGITSSGTADIRIQAV